MKNARNNQELAKKLALTPYMPQYFLRAWYEKTKGVAHRVWLTVKFMYWISMLKMMEIFVTCQYPMEHKLYGKIYKAKLRAELNVEYDHPSYDRFFDMCWMSNTGSGPMRVGLLDLLMRLNVKVMANNSLKSMCGIQPMSGPVSLVGKLRYKFDDTDVIVKDDVEENSTSLDGTVAQIEGSGGRKLYLDKIESAVQAKMAKSACTLGVDAISVAEKSNDSDNLVNFISSQINQVYIDDFINNVVGECEHTTITIEDTNIRDIEGFGGIARGLKSTSIDIARLTRRGCGNVLWLDPIMLANFQTYAPERISWVDREGTFDLEYVGILDGIMEVYCLSLPDGIDGILGYKGGHGESDAGIIMAPYIPVICSGISTDAETHISALPFATRYGMATNDIKGAYGGKPSPELADWKEYYRVIKVDVDIAALVARQQLLENKAA
jgi:hypothetical protein